MSIFLGHMTNCIQNNVTVIASYKLVESKKAKFRKKCSLQKLILCPRMTK